MAAKYNRRIYKAAGNSYTGRWKCFVAAFFVAIVFATSSLQAAPILVPSGLNPGDTYHLAFVSSTARDSISANIVDYDAHVQAAANAAAGGLEAITWRAIGSTATVNAIDHIGILGPVYRLDDVLLATSEADLWDGSIAAQLNITEAGTLATPSFGFGAAVLDGHYPERAGGRGVPAGSRQRIQGGELWTNEFALGEPPFLLAAGSQPRVRRLDRPDRTDTRTLHPHSAMVGPPRPTRPRPPPQSVATNTRIERMPKMVSAFVLAAWPASSSSTTHDAC